MKTGNKLVQIIFTDLIVSSCTLWKNQVINGLF